MIYTLRQKITDNIIVVMLVMSTGGLLFVFNRNLMYLIFMSFLVGTLLFSKNKTNRRLFNTLIFCLIIIIFLFWFNYVFALSGQVINKYMYYTLLAFVSSLSVFHFLNNRNESAFRSSLYFVLKILVFHALIQSLAYLFVGSNLQVISSSEYECTTFNYLFYYASTDIKKYSEISLFGLDIMRNQGLFWEAGVAQLFFNIFFFLEAFIFKKNKWLLLIAMFVIITTYSTIGIVILLMQMVCYFLFEQKSRVGILIFFIIILPISSVFMLNVEEKTTGDKEASFQKRYFDLVQPFFIAVENPLTGIGLDLYKFQEYRYEFYLNPSSYSLIEENIGMDLKMENTNEGSSNSFMFLLAAMGFPTGIFMIYLFMKQQIIKRRRVIFLLILSLSLFSSPLFLRPFFMFLIFSGFFYLSLKFVSFKK